MSSIQYWQCLMVMSNVNVYINAIIHAKWLFNGDILPFILMMTCSLIPTFTHWYHSMMPFYPIHSDTMFDADLQILPILGKYSATLFYSNVHYKSDAPQWKYNINIQYSIILCNIQCLFYSADKWAKCQPLSIQYCVGYSLNRRYSHSTLYANKSNVNKSSINNNI